MTQEKLEFNKHCMISSIFIFLQAKFYHDMPSETTSKINLVDLAGRCCNISNCLYTHSIFVLIKCQKSFNDK